MATSTCLGSTVQFGNSSVRQNTSVPLEILEGERRARVYSQKTEKTLGFVKVTKSFWDKLQSITGNSF